MAGKRGMSPVVATLLLVMLTIAGVAAIAGFVVPFISKSLKESTECANYKDYFIFDEDLNYNCYVSDGSKVIYGFSVKAKNDEKISENIEGFVVVLKAKDGTAKSYEIKSGKQPVEIKTCGKSSIEIPSAGGIKTYGFTRTSEEISSATIQAKLKSGRVCEEADKIDFYRCDYSIGEKLKAC